jgi:hypothetical protein
LIGCLGHELARLVCEFGPLICDVLGYRYPLLHWPAFAGVEREAVPLAISVSARARGSLTTNLPRLTMA